MAHDLICFSHARWGLVRQRVHHLMSRFAQTRRVLVVEDPVFDLTASEDPILEIVRPADVGAGRLEVVVPHVPAGATKSEVALAMRMLLDTLCNDERVRRPVLFYTTPTAFSWSRHLITSRRASATVYDCANAPELEVEERQLLASADLVFAAGRELWEAKRALHPCVHELASSVDVEHYHAARAGLPQPSDQACLRHSRVGFFGTVDERFDLALVAEVARLRPHDELVIVGPIAVDRARLPVLPNLHFLGPKPYSELPSYIAGWNVAMMPFVQQPSGRAISSAKALEYFAAGRPVVATSVPDVVRALGSEHLVTLADDAESFALAIDQSMKAAAEQEWLDRVDALLERTSWEQTALQMESLFEGVLTRSDRLSAA